MLARMSLVFRLEIIMLLRRAREWLYPLAFFIIVMSLFPLAFTPDPALMQKILPGAIWIAALLASLLAIEPVFAADIEDGALEQLLLAQPSLTFLLIAKLSAQWLVTQLPIVLLAPILGWLFQLPSMAVGPLFLSLLFGTPILTLVGGLGVALTLGLRQQGVWLSLLVLPLVTPVLIFGVNIVQQAQVPLSIVGPLSFLAGLCLLTITLVPLAITASLRISIDD